MSEKFHVAACYLLLACAASLQACSEPYRGDAGHRAHVLKASISQMTEDGAVRTTIDDAITPHPILWSANDGIMIHFDTDVATELHYYEIASGQGTTWAEFEYKMSATGNGVPAGYSSVVAGYPAMSVLRQQDNSEIVIEAQREIFLGLENVSEFPMHGTGGADGNLTFSCPFGMVCLPVTGSGTLVRLDIDTSGQQKEVTGYFHINSNTLETTFLQQVASGSPYVITWSGSAELSGEVSEFYAILPAGTYEAGTAMVFRFADGTQIERRTKMPFTVTRSHILNLPELNVEP